MDWSTIYDTAQQWGTIAHHEFKQWGWALLGVVFLIWQIRRIDDEQQKKNIGASRAIEQGIMSQEEISIRYLISIDANLEKIALILVFILMIGVFTLVAFNAEYAQGVRPT